MLNVVRSITTEYQETFTQAAD